MKVIKNQTAFHLVNRFVELVGEDYTRADVIALADLSQKAFTTAVRKQVGFDENFSNVILANGCINNLLEKINTMIKLAND